MGEQRAGLSGGALTLAAGMAGEARIAHREAEVRRELSGEGETRPFALEHTEGVGQISAALRGELTELIPCDHMLFRLAVTTAVWHNGG